MDWAAARCKTQIRRAAARRSDAHDTEGSCGSPHNSPLSTVHWWAVPPLRSAQQSHAPLRIAPHDNEALGNWGRITPPAAGA